MRLSCCWILNATMLLSASGHATPSTLLDWRAPEECPNATDLTVEIEELLGRPVAGVTQEGFHAQGVVTYRVDNAWHVSLTIQSQETNLTRELAGKSCWEVTRASAMVIAFALDPLLEEPQTEPGTDEVNSNEVVEFATEVESPKEDDARPAPVSPAPRPAPPAQPEQAPPLSEEDLPLRDRGTALTRSRFVPFLEPFATVDFGSLPGLAPGFGAALGLDFSDVRIEVLATFFPAQTAENAGSSGELDLLTGSLRACWLTRLEPFDLGACVRGEVGRLNARGLAVVVSEEASRMWLAPGAGGQAFLPLNGQLSLVAAVEGLLPLTRDEFVVQGAGVLHRPAPVSLRAALGLEARFR